MNLLNICRACLSSEGRVQLLDWLLPIDPSQDVLSYKECFCKCTQINLSLKGDRIETDEGRMQYLCFDCARKLKDAYEFIEKARRADNELRCTSTDTIKRECISNNFEWVPVEEQLENDKILEVSDQQCIEELKVIDIWSQRDIENGEKKLTNKLESRERSCDSLDEIGIALTNEEGSGSFTHIKFKTIKKSSKVKTVCDTSTKCNRNNELVDCEECGKNMTRNALRKHKLRHKPKTFLCQACPKTFSEASSLKNHELSHKENRERYPCDKCNQTFSTPYTYKRHMLTHENNRKPMYQCTQCDKSFLHKSGLKMHELQHKGATKGCNICQKRYVRQIDLDTHLRTHSGESPFECHICGKSFIHKRILNRHLQYHEGYFSYNCLICGETFSKYDKYYSHRMQHTGLPYKCGICEKQFPDAYKTKRHIRGVHKVEQDKEVKKLVVRINITKEYRGRIVEMLRNPEDEK